MKLQIFTVHDSKAEAYMNPFTMENKQLAIRGFQDAVNADTPFAKHPEDYCLFHVGSFSQETGIIEPIRPKSVTSALAVKAPSTEFQSLNKE